MQILTGKMIHYMLKLHAIRRSNSSNVFAEKLPSLIHSKNVFIEKRGLY